MLNTLKLNDEEEIVIKSYQFLTKKTFFFLGNISEHENSEKHLETLKNYGKKNDIDVLGINIQQELEISKISESEQADYLNLLGLKESALNTLISMSFNKLGLKNFFTVGEEEVRSWTYRNGWTIQECAGLIHTDLKTGFIKAKIIKYQDFVDCPNQKQLQDSGKVLIMGKNYLTEDGDIVKIEFKS